jgi:hypothetical protein
MSEKIASPTIFVKENTLLPAGLALQSEAFLPGWRSVTNLDGRQLGRKIEHAKWNYFYLANPIKITVFGREGLPSLRRAVKRILSRQQNAKQQNQSFNSLEITKIISKRILGVPYLSISAHFRHIQEGMYLISAKDFRLRDPSGTTSAPLATTVFGSVEKVLQEKAAAEPQVAVIPSS